MKVRFVYASFQRHAEAHPELREHVPCDEYFGPPSLGIAYLAASTPPRWALDFRDDRVEDPGFDDDVDLVAISCFTPSAERAMEIADAFRARGKAVVMGGIFPSVMPEVVAPHADAVVVGEGEGVWPALLEDFERGELRPRYRASSDVDPASLPLPRVDLYLDKEGDAYHPDDYPVQLSRGCMLRCHACAIPASLGKRLRVLPLEHAMGQIEQLEAHGKLASLTEDTSFFPASGAQRGLLDLLDALAERDREASVSYVGISMPMILATPGRILDRLHAAGIRMFYVVGGFDPITRAAFTGRDEKQRGRAIDAIRKCHDHGIDPYTSFLVGNEDDDEGVFDHMLEVADAAKLQKAEFAIFTPYPGTPAWAQLLGEERILHRRWSKYNDANVVFQPKQMSPDRLLQGYLYLWREFYRSRRHLAQRGHREATIQF
ncbi:MAG: cobalamin B12-binding domain-containing protein [Sandaracinaceae bacterium]|nr:cobalamin B12-binding domain-containing protein [Sandaracinaceae bacterium]